MMKKDFIYYTNKDGSREYAQDAPSIQAHTHTYTQAFILYTSIQGRILIRERMVDGQETTRYRTSRHCRRIAHERLQSQQQGDYYVIADMLFMIEH